MDVLKEKSKKNKLKDYIELLACPGKLMLVTVRQLRRVGSG
jgi:hypothetical protein